MTFKVDPGQVRSFAADLARLGEAAEVAKGYANQFGFFSLIETGILGKVHGRHADFLADLDATLRKLAMLLDASSASLHAAATQYERTDQRSAAEIDAARPGTSRPIAGVA